MMNNIPSKFSGNYSFFHRFFKGLYLDQYKSILQNLEYNVDNPKPTPTPTPQPIPYQREEREERSREDIAQSQELTLSDQLAGKYSIQGQPVKLQIPDFPTGLKGQSPNISKFVSGVASDGNMLTSLFPAYTAASEKAHAANIKRLMEEGVGGAGQVWSPSSGFVSVSLKVGEMNLFGNKLPTKTLMGNLPDVFVYGDKVFNMTRQASKNEFIALLEKNSQDRRNEIKNVERDRAEFKSVFKTEFKKEQEQFEKDKEDKDSGYAEDAVYYGSGGLDEYADSDKDDQPTVDEGISDTNLSVGKEEDNEEDYTPEPEEDYTFGDFNTGGFIGGMNPDQVTDAQTVADDYPVDADDGDFMINAAAIERDPQMFNQIISQGIQKAREKGVEVGDISGVGMDESGDVLASKGEFLVKKPLAETIGYDALNQFNNQGKPEVDRRVAASGGFLDGYASGGDISTPLNNPRVIYNFYNDIKTRFSDLPASRKVIDQNLNKLNDTEALALLAIVEGSTLGDKGMEAVMHVANNRAKSNYKNFKGVKTIKDVITSKTGRGAYEFSGFEIRGADPNKNEWDFRVQLSDMLSKASSIKKFNELKVTAEQILNGNKKDFTKGSLFFFNPEDSSISPTGESMEIFDKKVEAGEYLLTDTIEGPTARHVHMRPSEIPELEYQDESFLRSVETKKRASDQLAKAEANKMSQFKERLEPLPEPEGLSQKTFLGNILGQGVKPQTGMRN